MRRTHREQTGEGAEGYVQTYRVSDRIPLGPLTLPTTNVARVRVPADGDVTAEAHQFPRVRVRTIVTFESVDGGKRITEALHIEAPRPLAATTTRKAVKAHTAMLAGFAVVLTSYSDASSTLTAIP